jgi:egghead protein (zeste-white 4 protein)
MSVTSLANSSLALPPHLRIPAILAAVTIAANVLVMVTIAYRARQQRRAGGAPVPAPEVTPARSANADADADAEVRSATSLRRIAGRAAGIITAIVLIAVYLLAVVPTVAAVPLIFGLDTSVALGPGGRLYNLAATVLTVALVLVALRFVYYYRCWFTSRQWFRRPEPPAVAELVARDLPFMKVQVTTKGGALPVVERSLRELEQICQRHPALGAKISAEVVTEVAEEARSLQDMFADSALPVTGILLPPDYSTPRGTQLKARALHYVVELRRAGLNRKPGPTYIVHFDEETLVTEEHLLVLADYLSNNPRPVSQGPILYPLEWSQTPLLCRALECMRPFGCSECARVMENPPPPHLHGSNLVVEEQAENLIGWDLGMLKDQPYVAEDLLFGLRAYSELGDNAFGWHGATMLEQPPLTVFWAVQQRMRWVLGALQGLWAMRHDPAYDGISRYQKRRLALAIGTRIATYCLGYPLGFAGLYFFFRPAHVNVSYSSPLAYYRLLIIAAGIGWLASYQIGLARNLRYQQMRRRTRIAQHIGMLLVTPLAGLCETVGPYVAVLRWLVGYRKARWTPTPKLTSDHPRATPAGTAEIDTSAVVVAA